MITLHIDLTTAGEEKGDIVKHEFDKMLDLEMFLMLEINQHDKKVYVFSYADAEEDGDGIVFIDHSHANILDHSSSHLRDFYEGGVEAIDMNVFLFACDNYNDAYELALDLKEPTGMLKWQLEEDATEASIANGGIKFTSSAS